jgi:phospholipid/cholesterol/gamma-HCH transport system substrate-binding protein
MGRHGVAETLTGALVLVVAVAFLAYAVAHSGRTAGSGYTLEARFDHIDGLAVGGDVRIAGVKVGTVTEERLDPKTFSAIVLMTVQDSIQLPKDSAASITSESLLGGKYISLSPGGDEVVLKPGQAITITQSSVSLEELLGKFIFSVTSLNESKDGQSGASQSGASQLGGTKSDGKAGSGDQQSGGQQQGGSAGLAPLSK